MTADRRARFVVFADPRAFRDDPHSPHDTDARAATRAALQHARDAEASGAHALFKPDFLGYDGRRTEWYRSNHFEPVTLLAAQAAVTEAIGLIATASTTFSHPYALARTFASLDAVSGGRAGWNIVTSFNGEKLFGLEEMPTTAQRYERGAEFSDLVHRIWKSGAGGPAVGEFTHEGRSQRFEGAQDLAASPQGSPYLFAAGSSEEGNAFAARFAEGVFAAVPTIAHAQRYRSDLDELSARVGRTSPPVRIFPGLKIFTADTDAQARERYEAEFSPDYFTTFRDKLRREAPWFGFDHLDLDDAISPQDLPTDTDLDAVERRKSRGYLLRELAAVEGQTVREFLRRSHGFGHLDVVGSHDSVVAQLQPWIESGHVDGFTLKGGDSYSRIAAEILPRLAARGLLHPPCSADLTLRENFQS